MKRHLLKTMVAVLAIAAAAIGPAGAQTNTVTWYKYQLSELNLMQGDRETIDDVTITCNDGTASNNGGDVSFNGAFTFSVPAGSVLTQIVIKDETWLSVTGWSLDGSETEATWTGSARSVACQITTSNAQYIEFTIASAVPKMYTSEVSITDLVPGDTLAEGATIIGSGDDDDMVFLGAGRAKANGVVQQFWTNLFLPPTVIGTNGTISGTNTYTPVDENGQDGTAWVVTTAELNDYDGFEVGLSGIRIPGPPITVRMAAGTEEAANWSLASGNASVPGNQVLENVMSGSQVTATYNGTTKKVKSVKAVKYVPPAATVTTAPTATEAIIEANTTTALVNAGAANGGTMMYAVTTTNVQPASTADFSATRPTAEGRTAGTYYVWYYAKADADHSDSEIAGPVSVTLPVITTVTWSSSNVFNSGHEGEELDSWSPNPRTYEGITISGSELDYSYFRAYDGVAQTGKLSCRGDEGESFTFTAPAGKKFCKIEIINDEWSIGFTNYGDWTQPEDTKIVWSGTAASTVTLSTVFASASSLNSIVFKLIDAQ